MLKLNESQAEALWDALDFGETWFDTPDDPGEVTLRMHCTNLAEKIDNRHTQFTSVDICVMSKAVNTIIENGEDITQDHIKVRNLLLDLKDSDSLTIQYI